MLKPICYLSHIYGGKCQTNSLHVFQVIQDNLCSMQRMLEDLEKCKGELHIPQRAEEGLQVYSKARLLLQSLEELEHLTQQQASLLEVQHV